MTSAKVELGRLPTENTMHKLRIAAFASGRGSNLAAILDSIKRGTLDCEVVLVMSNKPTAGVLNIARTHGIAALHLAQEQFEHAEDFDRRLLGALAEHQVEMIVLAGYLKKINPAIIRDYKNRILNIHPARLPAFGGKGMYVRNVHQAVLDYGCKVSGVTVHLVDEEYDRGTPVLQKCVPVKEGDTAESLAARVLVEEHKIFSEALQLFAEGRVEVRGRRAVIRE
ncbi:MAG: phosphoribosylglycinamide formyltransferase [Calditrichaeota bacterium]|nr:phosphoribosylglycinamide formyltransferase [Calditrichota bacterium]